MHYSDTSYHVRIIHTVHARNKYVVRGDLFLHKNWSEGTNFFFLGGGGGVNQNFRERTQQEYERAEANGLVACQAG